MWKSLLLLLVCSLTQQPLPVYDAVTIKISDPASRGTHVDADDATFKGGNLTLKHLLVNAYGIRESLIFDLPKWAESTRFDINAKVTDPDVKLLRSLTREQRSQMVAAMLADRFHLRAHIEVKTLPVYELVVARDGPRLKLSAPPADPSNPGNGNMSVHNTDMTASGILLADLALNLSMPLDHTIIDKTGLPGRYDFHLLWTADNLADSAPPDAPPVLLTAIQEQLGLKLQPAKGPVPTLVIDHVDLPTGN